jgi:hypothetical protein
LAWCDLSFKKIPYIVSQTKGAEASSVRELKGELKERII